MDSDQNNNSGCLFPFGDDFLPIFMFFFHLNDPGQGSTDFEDPFQTDPEDSESDDDEDNDW